MRYIEKRVLEDFDLYVEKRNPKTWSSLSTRIKLELNQHLWEEQKGLCIYCQQEIPYKSHPDTEDSKHPSHIEHIRPKCKDKYPELTFVQSNLALSCNGFVIDQDSQHDIKSKFCGHRKDNEYDETLFLNPIDLNDIEDYFEYNAFDGSVAPPHDGNEELKRKSAYMIETLSLMPPEDFEERLNSTNLVRMRKQQIELYSALNSKELSYALDEDQSTYPAFFSMLKQFFS